MRNVTLSAHAAPYWREYVRARAEKNDALKKSAVHPGGKSNLKLGLSGRRDTDSVGFRRRSARYPWRTSAPSNFHTCGGRRPHSRGKFPPPECLSEAARWRRTTATADRIPGSLGRIDAAQLPLVSPARPPPPRPPNSSVPTFFFSATSASCLSRLATPAPSDPGRRRSLFRTLSGRLPIPATN